MKIRLFSLSLLFAAILYSCQEKDYEIDIKADVPKIKKVIIADQPFYEYSYTNADIVSQERSMFNSTTFSYNDKAQLMITDYYSDNALLGNDLQVIENALAGKGLLNLTDSQKGGTLEFKYDIYGQLIKTIFGGASGSNPESSEFSYDSNSRIGRQTLLWENKIIGYIDYLYDGGGNLIKETLFSITSSGIPELNTTTQYEFDSYQNPFKAFYRLMTPGINTNPNNIIKETYTIHFKPGQGTDIVQITINSYDYDSKGYPVRKNGNIEFLYE
jgi:hypothetical protein